MVLRKHRKLDFKMKVSRSKFRSGTLLSPRIRTPPPEPNRFRIHHYGGMDIRYRNAMQLLFNAAKRRDPVKTAKVPGNPTKRPRGLSISNPQPRTPQVHHKESLAPINPKVQGPILFLHLCTL